LKWISNRLKNIKKGGFWLGEKNIFEKKKSLSGFTGSLKFQVDWADLMVFPEPIVGLGFE